MEDPNESLPTELEGEGIGIIIQENLNSFKQ